MLRPNPIVLFCLFMTAAFTLTPAAAQTDGRLKWAFTTQSSTLPGAILSSPAIGADGTVYFGMEVGSGPANASGRLFAITAAGGLKWVNTTPDWIDSTPAIGADGTVYVGCWDGKLYAYAPDGSKKWEYNAGSYIASSPAVSGDGTIYIGAGDLNLHAVNPDGTLKWLHPTADWVDGTPAIGADGTVYVGAGSTLYAVQQNGVGKWQAALLGGIVGSPAISADGTVIVGSRDTRLYAFSTDGTLLWSFSAGDGFEASPVLGRDGTIYIGSLDGRFYALSSEGKEKWRYPRAGQPPLQPLFSSAAVRADGSLVFGSSDNAVYALTGDGTLLWKTAIGDWADSSPVIGPDGTIYLGSYDKKLYALSGTSVLADTDWPGFKRDVLRAGWQSRGLAGGGAGRLIATSVRARSGSDSDSLIVGFHLTGSGKRRMLVRGVGPGLIPLGCDGVMPDPQLRIRALGAPEALVDNDDWSSASNASEIASRAASVGEFPLANPSRDAAVLYDFAEGGYTAQITSGNNSHGLAMAEIYDTGGTGSRLNALAVRAQSEGGDGVLIAGFAISGGRRAVLIRGLGPALVQAGVAGAMADPLIRIYDTKGTILVENDNWRDSPNSTATASAMLAVGMTLPATQSKDASLLVMLEEGAYMVHVNGVGGSTGVALIELYELP